MKFAMKLLRALRRDQRGLTTVEYLIVLCLLAGVAVTTWKSFGEEIRTMLGDSGGHVITEMEAADRSDAMSN